MHKNLIIIGIILILAGILLPWLEGLSMGRLPGDIMISKANLKIYFPITTMLVISLVFSVILWLFHR